MFNFRKHNNSIALAFSLSYEPDYKYWLLCMSFYKYELTLSTAGE